MGTGKFQPPQNQYPTTDRQKIRHNWLRPRGDPLYRIW